MTKVMTESLTPTPQPATTPQAYTKQQALIRQLVEELEKINAAMPFPVGHRAIAAGRAWLEKHESY